MFIQYELRPVFGTNREIVDIKILTNDELAGHVALRSSEVVEFITRTRPDTVLADFENLDWGLVGKLTRSKLVKDMPSV